VRAHLGGAVLIDYPRFCQSKDRHEPQGLTASQIAHALALAPRTVAYGLPHERLRPRKATPQARKLDPFKPQIVQRLAQYP
jgi:hypothetical protein